MYAINFKRNLYIIKMGNSIIHTISNRIEFALAKWFVFTTIKRKHTRVKNDLL